MQKEWHDSLGNMSWKKAKRRRYYFTSEDITSTVEANHRPGVLVWNSHLFSKLRQWKKKTNVVLSFKNTYKCYKIEKIRKLVCWNSWGVGTNKKTKRANVLNWDRESGLNLCLSAENVGRCEWETRKSYGGGMMGLKILRYHVLKLRLPDKKLRYSSLSITLEANCYFRVSKLLWRGYFSFGAI